MAMNALFLALGLLLAAVVLKDVFDTVVVPGGSRTSLRVAHRLTVVSLPVWKKIRGRRRGLSGTFAPFVLVSCFIIWMMLLALAFGLMSYAFRADFEPPLRSFFDAVYIVGSSLVTVGLSQATPAGTARWIVLGAGFCGLAVMTMAVTYLLEVQGSVSRRDTAIIKLNTSAGQPPSALTLLERFAALRNRSALRSVLVESRDWCATVRQSHSSHPSLIYFQSVGTGAGWPAALGAVLDLALLAEHLIAEDDLYGPAVLLREEGARMARELALMISVEPVPSKTDPAELEQAQERLASSGYPLRRNPSLTAMAGQRAEHMSCVDALAAHLGRPTTVLVRQS
jgi:uncharacterized membrane protein YecN with MAPEG domain